MVVSCGQTAIFVQGVIAFSISARWALILKAMMPVHKSSGLAMRDYFDGKGTFGLPILFKYYSTAI